MTSTAATLEHRKPRPIASGRHTLFLGAILLIIAIRGAMYQTAVGALPALHNVWPLYIGLVASELILVYRVLRGIRSTGTTIADLVGPRWKTPTAIAVDVLLGIALWTCILGLSAAWNWWAPFAAPVRSINPLLPIGPAESIAWICVSFAGGISEEIVFRGYFQRQFEAWMPRRWLAVMLQAIVFGVSHGYQGVSACLKITLIGALFGLLAMWRRSLRPGMIAHVWTDIASGVFRI